MNIKVLYLLEIPVFILCVVFFKMIFRLGISDLGTLYFEPVLIGLIQCGLLLFTFLLIKFVNHKLKDQLLLGFVLFVCVMTAYVFVRSTDIYHKVLPVKYYSPMEKVKDIEHEILNNSKYDRIDLEYAFKAIDLYYEDSKEFNRSVAMLIDKFIVFEDESVKLMNPRDIVAQIARMESNGLELIKKGNRLFLLKRKDSARR